MMSFDHKTTLLALTLLLAIFVNCAAQPGKNSNDKLGKAPPPMKENLKPSAPGGRGPPPNVTKTGSKDSKSYLMSSGGFNVEVNGNGQTPFFRYWDSKSEDEMQKLAFTKMWQTSTPTNITASKPKKMVNLKGMYTWVFGDLTEVVDAATNTTDVSFKLTGSAKDNQNADQPKPGLEFTFHLLSNGNGTEMKFDVDITGFQSSWWADSTSSLVLGYRVSTVDKSTKEEKADAALSDMRIQKDANRPIKPQRSDSSGGGAKPKAAIDFGNGNGFEIVSTATEGSGKSKTVSMTALTTPEDGTLILIMYEQFITSLRHDPTMYTAGTSSTLDASAALTFTDASLYDSPILSSSTAVDTSPSPGSSSPSAASSSATAAVMGTTLLALVAVLLTSF